MMYGHYNPSTSMVQSMIQFSLGTILLLIIAFLINAYGWYKVDKKLNGKNPTWIFIPILDAIELYRLGDVNPLNLLWILFPIIGVLITTYYSIKVLVNITKKAGKPTWYVIFHFLPYIAIFYPFIIMPKESKEQQT